MLFGSEKMHSVDLRFITFRHQIQHNYRAEHFFQNIFRYA